MGRAALVAQAAGEGLMSEKLSPLQKSIVNISDGTLSAKDVAAQVGCSIKSVHYTWRKYVPRNLRRYRFTPRKLEIDVAKVARELPEAFGKTAQERAKNIAIRLRMDSANDNLAAAYEAFAEGKS